MEKYPSVRKIDRAEHVAMVQEIFASVPARYDFLNHLLSARRDVAWRRFAAGRLRLFRTNRFLDVATGTADLALEAVRRHPQVDVVGLDFAKEMMDLGQEKAARRNLGGRITFVRGDALQMPFPAGSFDAAGIAFGIRNIPEKVRALREMARVVVPGGQVLILEMQFPDTVLFRPLYHLYLNRVLPLVARTLSPNPDAYFYLADSVMNFPSPESFMGLMREAGLIGVTCRALTLGTACLYVGYRPTGAG